jgi:dephospho-CoA kinase
MMTKIIGLTGGIGSGKSTVANYIASKGIPVYIADEVAKQIMETVEVKSKIQNIFKTDILTEDNRLNRKKIAAIVFNSPEKLKKLNAIVHPEVQKHFKNWLKEQKAFPFVIKEVAVLFETGGNTSCDEVILITAPEEIRIERAMKRDNASREDILNRMKNQLPEEEKVKKSHHIIDNIDLKSTFKSIDEILKLLLNK